MGPGQPRGELLRFTGIYAGVPVVQRPAESSCAQIPATTAELQKVSSRAVYLSFVNTMRMWVADLEKGFYRHAPASNPLIAALHQVTWSCHALLDAVTEALDSLQGYGYTVTA